MLPASAVSFNNNVKVNSLLVVLSILYGPIIYLSPTNSVLAPAVVNVIGFTSAVGNVLLFSSALLIK